MKLGFFRCLKRIDEGLILILRHRAIEIGFLFFFGLALVIARLHPGDVHVYAVGIDNRRDGIKERQTIRASFLGDGFAKFRRGQGARGENPVAFVRQLINLFKRHGNILMRINLCGDPFGKNLAIHSQSTARWQAMFFRAFHDQTVRGTHFPMQKPHSVLFVIIRTEGVGTDHLAKIARLMRKGFHLGPHLMQHNLDALVRRLPSRLRASHASANDV